MGNQQPLHVKPTSPPNPNPYPHPHPQPPAPQPHYNFIFILLRYIGNLDYECTSEELYYFLSDFGEIDFVDLPLK